MCKDRSVGAQVGFNSTLVDCLSQLVYLNLTFKPSERNKRGKNQKHPNAIVSSAISV